MQHTKGFAYIVLLGLIALLVLILFIPIPFYNHEGTANCLLVEDCPEPGWNLGPSLFTKLTINNSTKTDNYSKSITNRYDSGWKIYKNQDSLYQISYPSSWRVEEKEDTLNVSLIPPSANEDNLFDGSVFIIPDHLDLKTNDLRESIKIYQENVRELHDYSSTEFITLGNNEFWIATGGCCMDIGKHAFIQRDTSLYRITLSDMTSDTTEDEIQTFYQILSTFQFLDNSLPDKAISTTLTVSCKDNSDCKKYISRNNCELYCANTNTANENVLSLIPKECDPTLWDPPLELNCGCIQEVCQIHDES